MTHDQFDRVLITHIKQVLINGIWIGCASNTFKRYEKDDMFSFREFNWDTGETLSSVIEGDIATIDAVRVMV